MKKVNSVLLGNSNTYLIKGEKGYLLIDAGFPNTVKTFLILDRSIPLNFFNWIIFCSSGRGLCKITVQFCPSPNLQGLLIHRADTR